MASGGFTIKAEMDHMWNLNSTEVVQQLSQTKEARSSAQVTRTGVIVAEGSSIEFICAGPTCYHKNTGEQIETSYRAH